MLSLKSITETLATLGGGALLLAGCGGSPDAAEVPAQPAAAEHKHDGAAGSCASGSCGGHGDKAAAPEGAAEPTVDPAATNPTPAVASPPPADAKAVAPAPATSAAAAPPPATTAKPTAPKKPAGTAGAPAKKGAQGSCGEGTCG